MSVNINYGGANYGGRQATGMTAATIKTFYEGNTSALFKQVTTSVGLALQPINYQNLYVPNTLFCTNVNFISDSKTKDNIAPIDTATTDKIMNLKPSSFIFKNDTKKLVHYGFIAQDVETEFPNLIQEKHDKKYGIVKTLNYLEMIPLLVDKIQMMQKEIDELKDKINTNNT
jgi:hypothetical protein